LKFTICSQLTFEANTTGRIINDLAIQWIWYKKHYFRICRGEKLKNLNWREIEEHKLLEEETPPTNNLCNKHSLFTMNNIKFSKMINLMRYHKSIFRKPNRYNINFNSSQLKIEKDFIFKLTPSDIGHLYQKISLN
jgi:hypothetical protein